MTDQLSIPALLRKHFPALSERDLQDAIAEHGQLMQFPAGETIMDFGSYIRMVPLLISGSIKVLREDPSDAREIFLYYIGPGQTCSMSFSCCMMKKRSDIRTVAEEDTQLIGLPIDKVSEWMAQYPSWRNFVMRAYDERLREMVHTIDWIAFRQMDARLLQYLQQKAEVINSNTFHITHQEIAQDLNASREAISRLLKKLENDGKVVLGRHQIKLLL
ncbi:MAG: Crp/Fnr family transcriptional regulator [Bacteroidota bacterium]